MSRARRAGRAPSISLFGLAPHGVCPAPSVAVGAVRSYRTVSPLPSDPGKEPKGGFFSVALSFALPRPGVTRHAARSEFGLSSPVARGDRVARSEPAKVYHSLPVAIPVVLEPLQPFVDIDLAAGIAGIPRPRAAEPAPEIGG